MIEVERKFKLTPKLMSKLIAGTEFLKEITMKDVYYDDQQYTLTTSDRWLRNRNGSWELKLPAHYTPANRLIDQYTELEDTEEIRKALHLPDQGTLEEALARREFISFCTYTTNRKKYRRGDMVIDVDTIDFGYEVAEIEKMVKTQEDVPGAVADIESFAKELGLEPTLVRDKTTEYLKRNSPEHYQKLQDAGVV